MFSLVATANQVAQHVPPHSFMGYRLGEWVSITTLILFLAGIIIWLVKVTIVNPSNLANRALKQSIDQLSSKVDGIGSNADRVHEEHDRRLDNHETRITVNEQEINDLKEKMK